MDGACKLCEPKVEEDLVHALIRCPGNQGVGQAVLHCLPPASAGIGDHKVLKLQLQLDNSFEFPAVWFLAVAWFSIWESRKLNKRPELYKVRADLEAKVSLLRETRRHSEAEEISSMISML